MINVLTAFRTPVTILFVCALISASGCGKKVVSSTGDELAASKDPRAAGAVESVQPDRMVTVPDGSGTSPDTLPGSHERGAAAREVPDGSGTSPDTLRPRFDGPSAGADPTSPQMGGAPGGPGSGDRLTTPDAPFSALSSEGKGLGDIFFDFDRYTIRADAQPVLEANASRLKTISGKIVIEGHCDERGTEAYNLVLGEKRARATKRYLEDLGVPSTRMKIISYGEIRPFCRERDEQCYQLNRRAHFVVQ